MKTLTSKHGKKMIAMVIALTLVMATAITASASWYGFSHKFIIPGRTETTVYDAEYDGNSVGADIWIHHDSDIYIPSTLQFEFIIQKKEWWGWKDVAMEKCGIDDQGTVKAWNVGSGRYRFRVYIPFTATDGKLYATKFESYSWE